MLPRLIVVERRAENVEALRRALGACDGVSVMHGTGPESLSGLDAVFLTLPQAEMWGSRPLPPHVCEILTTPDELRAKGYPRYAVTGIALFDGEPYTGPSIVGLLVSCVVNAVQRFNELHGLAIRTVGVQYIQSFAPGLPLLDIGRLLASEYEAMTAGGTADAHQDHSRGDREP